MDLTPNKLDISRLKVTKTLIISYQKFFVESNAKSLCNSTEILSVMCKQKHSL